MQRRHCVPTAFACLLLLTATLPALQTDPVIGWLTRLQAIQRELNRQDAESGPAIAPLASELEGLRREVEAQRNIISGLTLPDHAPVAGRTALIEEAAALRQALEEQQRSHPGGAFHLARMEVNVTAELPQVSTAGTLDEMEYRKRNSGVITDALELVPGVSVQRNGPRNERGVFVRGFDVRQVPLYVDGIPVYVPYDGYVDLDRFLTYDVSEMEVSKGFSSSLYGPNALGGAINLITKAPSKPLTLDLGTGYGSGREVNAFGNVGVKWKQYWVQGSYAWLSRDTFPLSGNFRPLPLQGAGDRENADQRDYKGRIRFGWTPNVRDQYTFTYANQQGEKGNPVKPL